MGNIRKKKHGPEWHIQNAIREYLTCREWRVERFIGNALQFGIPDLYAFHRRHGERWIDVKTPGRYDFTQQQKIKWPIWADFNRGIWIMTAADQENYDLLFDLPNWKKFWKKTWGVIPDIETLLSQVAELDAAEE